jgi:hypothetical protein
MKENNKNNKQVIKEHEPFFPCVAGMNKESL